MAGWPSGAIWYRHFLGTLGVPPPDIFCCVGFEYNRRTIEVFSEQAHAAGIVSRRITAEEYSSDYLEAVAV